MKKAMTKIKTSLTNNVDLKIIAVIIASIVWLAVINISDPEKTLTIYGVPVTITDESSIIDRGMVYEVTSSKYVNVTVTGKRSIVSNLSANDFKATASLKELSKVNAVPIEVELKNRYMSRKLTIAKQSVQTLTVSVENLEKQEYNIEVDFSGTLDNGYVVGSYSLSRSTMTVKAPVSVHDKIERVVAICNLDGKNSDISQKCKLILYDKHNKEIKESHIKLSNQKVRVDVSILKEKEIPLDMTTDHVGQPAAGYQISGVTLSQETVKIVGAENLLDSVDRLEITEDFDVSNEVADISKNIDLSQYLPEGVSVNGEKIIQVTIHIDKLATKTYNIKASDIIVNHLEENLELKYLTKSIAVTLRGESDAIGHVTKEQVQASIDLDGYEKGTETVPVFLSIPDNTELVEQVFVKIKLK